MPEYLEQKIVCQNCLDEFIIKRNIHSIPSKRKFCSRSCATSFRNKNHIGWKRPQSSIDKQKESVKDFWRSEEGKKEKERRSIQGKNQMSKEKYRKIFFDSIEKWRNDPERYNKSIEKKKNTIAKKVKAGEWNSWNTRNIRSYAEIYTENFLRKNNISDFETEKYISKKELGENKMGGYFLDFYFPKFKINLEIDGAQHEREERKLSDSHRDFLLRKRGINVIRIKWVNIKNSVQRKVFLDNLVNFLTFLNK